MKRVWRSFISEENIIKWRRHFHKYPELSFHEKETSQFIYDTLCSFSSFEVTRPTKYSVLAIKRGTETRESSCDSSGYRCFTNSRGDKETLCVCE